MDTGPLQSAWRRPSRYFSPGVFFSGHALENPPQLSSLESLLMEKMQLSHASFVSAGQEQLS